MFELRRQRVAVEDVDRDAFVSPVELAWLLLEAGADPNDSQAIYNHAWSPGDEWLYLLLEHGLGTGSGGPWHAG